MKINVTKKIDPNYGKRRTKKVFALLPRWLHYEKKDYFVWLEWFFQDEHYRYNALTDSDGWVIESRYPII